MCTSLWVLRALASYARDAREQWPSTLSRMAKDGCRYSAHAGDSDTPSHRFLPDRAVEVREEGRAQIGIRGVSPEDPAHLAADVSPVTRDCPYEFDRVSSTTDDGFFTLRGAPPRKARADSFPQIPWSEGSFLHLRLPDGSCGAAHRGAEQRSPPQERSSARDSGESPPSV
jgi:hypothetical protein